MVQQSVIRLQLIHAFGVNFAVSETYIGKEFPEAKIVKLDELYPDFNINIESEQEKLLRVDIIVFEMLPPMKATRRPTKTHGSTL